MFNHYPLRFVLMALMSMVVGLVGACAAMGGIQPDTYREKLAYAKITVTGARQLGGTFLDARKIDADDAQAIQLQADAARDGIKAVEKMQPTNPAAAELRLDGIVAGLRGLATYLNSKAPPTPLSVTVKGTQ